MTREKRRGLLCGIPSRKAIRPTCGLRLHGRQSAVLLPALLEAVLTALADAVQGDGYVLSGPEFSDTGYGSGQPLGERLARQIEGKCGRDAGRGYAVSEAPRQHRRVRPS